MREEPAILKQKKEEAKKTIEIPSYDLSPINQALANKAELGHTSQELMIVTKEGVCFLMPSTGGNKEEGGWLDYAKLGAIPPDLLIDVIMKGEELYVSDIAYKGSGHYMKGFEVSQEYLDTIARNTKEQIYHYQYNQKNKVKEFRVNYLFGVTGPDDKEYVIDAHGMEDVLSYPEGTFVKFGRITWGNHDVTEDYIERLKIIEEKVSQNRYKILKIKFEPWQGKEKLNSNQIKTTELKNFPKFDVTNLNGLDSLSSDKFQISHLILDKLQKITQGKVKLLPLVKKNYWLRFDFKNRQQAIKVAIDLGHEFLHSTQPLILDGSSLYITDDAAKHAPEVTIDSLKSHIKQEPIWIYPKKDFPEFYKYHTCLTFTNKQELEETIRILTDPNYPFINPLDILVKDLEIYLCNGLYLNNINFIYKIKTDETFRTTKSLFEDLFNQRWPHRWPSRFEEKPELIQYILSIPNNNERKKAILACFKKNQYFCDFMHTQRGMFRAVQLTRGETKKLFDALKNLELTLEEVDKLYSTDKKTMDEFKEEQRVQKCKQLTFQELQTYLKNLSVEEAAVIAVTRMFNLNEMKMDLSEVFKISEESSRLSDLDKKVLWGALESTILKAMNKYHDLKKDTIQPLEKIAVILLIISSVNLKDYISHKMQVSDEIIIKDPELFLEYSQNQISINDKILMKTLHLKEKFVQMILNKKEDEKEKLIFQCFDGESLLYQYIHIRRGGDPIEFNWGCTGKLTTEFEKIILNKINARIPTKETKKEIIDENINALDNIKNIVEGFKSQSSIYDNIFLFKENLLKKIAKCEALNWAYHFLLNNEITVDSLKNFFNFLANENNEEALKRIDLTSILKKYLEFFQQKIKSQEISLDFVNPIVNMTHRFINLKNIDQYKTFKSFAIKCFSLSIINGHFDNYVQHQKLFELIPHLKEEWLLELIEKTKALPADKKIDFLLSCFKLKKNNGLANFIWQFKKQYKETFQALFYDTSNMHNAIKTLLHEFFNCEDKDNSNKYELFNAIAEVVSTAKLTETNDHVFLIIYVWEKLETTELKEKFAEALKNKNIDVTEKQINKIKGKIILYKAEKSKGTLNAHDIKLTNKEFNRAGIQLSTNIIETNFLPFLEKFELLSDKDKKRWKNNKYNVFQLSKTAKEEHVEISNLIFEL